MKRVALYTLVLLMMSCANAQWGKRIRGNGNMVSDDRSTGTYDAIAVSGSFDVDLVDGREGQVTVRAEENLQEYIITEVKNGTLVIKTKDGVNINPSGWKVGMHVTVPVEDINSVSLSGSGDITGKTLIRAHNFNTSMSGSGDISLEVEADALSTSMSGSGDMNLRGKAGHFDVEISGSGDVDAFGLDAREVDARISGSADIRVSVNEMLKARVSGSGNIRYRGNPTKIDSKTAGSGGISKG